MFSFPFIKRTVANDITIRLFVYIFVIAIIVSSIVYKIDVGISEKIFVDKTIDKINNISSVLKEPVWNLENNEIGRILDLYLETPEIVKVEVKNDYHYYVKSKDLNQFSIDYELSGKISTRNELVGKVTIYFTKKYLQEHIRSTLYFVLFIFCFVILVANFIIHFLLKRYLKIPFNELTQIIDKITKGNYKVKGSVFRQDDINEIISGFNIMSDKLAIRDKELNATKKYLSNIINSMSSVIISIDKNGRITGWNNAAEAFSKIMAEEARGKLLWEVEPWFIKYKKYFSEVIQTGNRLEFKREVFKKERILYSNITLYPLSPTGPKGVVLRLDDITELENKELQLRQAQKMETVGTLAGGLAHDFNNVLGGIIGILSLIRFKLKNGNTIDSIKLEDYVSTMELSSQRAADMVNQLLTLSRKKETISVPVDLNMTVKHINKICNSTFDKSIDKKVKYYNKPAVINGDPAQIEQLLLNLCINASHAMTIMRSGESEKGGELKILVEKVLIGRDLANIYDGVTPGEFWLLRVRDNGVGIPENIKSKIFDPFYTTKDKNNGTGLGLAMVYSIISRHQGFIEVESEVGKGSEFKVYLPVLERKKSHDLQNKIGNTFKGSGKILVMEDEKIIRNLAQEILLECGYLPIFASDGLEGVKLYREFFKEIKLVILDLGMPKVTAKETFTELKEINPEIKVLLASGSKYNEKVDELLKLGVKGFLHKPYTLDEMANTVGEVIKSR